MIDVARNKLLRLREVAQHFEVSYQTALKWVVSGKLEATRVGGSWRTTEEAIRAFSEQSTREEFDRLRGVNPPAPEPPRKPSAITSRGHQHYAAMFRAEGYSV